MNFDKHIHSYYSSMQNISITTESFPFLVNVLFQLIPVITPGNHFFLFFLILKLFQIWLMRNSLNWLFLPYSHQCLNISLLSGILRCPRPFDQGFLQGVLILFVSNDIQKLKFGCWLHQFPRAAIAKHHELGGLKQQKFTVSQFWRLEV